MPKLFEDSGFTFRFYAADLDEPIHVHIEKDDHIAKFWVNPLTCAVDGGFNNRELRRIAQIIASRQQEIIEKWHQMEGRRRNAGRSN
ncbi:MAG: DUF4160 domain-containing protein [Caldilineaceae bacterium]